MDDDGDILAELFWQDLIKDAWDEVLECRHRSGRSLAGKPPVKAASATRSFDFARKIRMTSGGRHFNATIINDCNEICGCMSILGDGRVS